MLIGYAKIGRAISLSPKKWGVNGGDNEPAVLLHRLLAARPNDTFVLLSPCKDDAEDIPDRVINPWVGSKMPQSREAGKGTSKFSPPEQQRVTDLVYDTWIKSFIPQMDGFIVWAGQHGTTQNRIPMVGDGNTLTSPQDCVTFYGGPIVQAINAWRDLQPYREEIWLCSDVRNYVKARDLKWPITKPILGQHDQTRAAKHFRYGDAITQPPTGWHWDDEDRLWTGRHEYKYAGLELCGLDVGDSGEKSIDGDVCGARFGVVMNETRIAGGNLARVKTFKDWVAPFDPAYVYGYWSKESQREIGYVTEVLPYPAVQDILSNTTYTVTTPGSGAGWATAKPWECFRAGTICFFHPAYDTQNHILGDAPKLLQEVLRPQTPGQMGEMMRFLDDERSLRDRVVMAQWRHFSNRMMAGQILTEIGDRLDG